MQNEREFLKALYEMAFERGRDDGFRDGKREGYFLAECDAYERRAQIAAKLPRDEYGRFVKAA